MCSRSFLMQPFVSLDCITDQWDQTGIIQPERQWVDTSGARNLILEVLVPWRVPWAILSIEGTDEPDGEWNVLQTFTVGEPNPRVVRLSQKRSRTARAGRLWRLIRWRWHCQSPAETMNGSSISFKIKAVMKP